MNKPAVWEEMSRMYSDSHPTEEGGMVPELTGVMCDAFSAWFIPYISRRACRRAVSISVPAGSSDHRDVALGDVGSGMGWGWIGVALGISEVFSILSGCAVLPIGLSPAVKSAHPFPLQK